MAAAVTILSYVIALSLDFCSDVKINVAFIALSTICAASLTVVSICVRGAG